MESSELRSARLGPPSRPSLARVTVSLMGLLGAVVGLGVALAAGLGGLFWLLADLIRKAAAS